MKSRFRALLDEHGEQPPLDELCYLICQLGGHPIDIAEQQAQLDFAAQQLPASFEGVVSSLFAEPSGLRGNRDDYYNVSNSMLSEVQRTRLGIPITLSVLAMEHARRVDVPVVGIGLPGHFIIGSGDDSDLFADPFNGGELLDIDGVRRLHRQSTGDASTWRDSYLRPMRNRDVVFRILNNLSGACKRSFADRDKLPWVLELMSWFPHGAPYDDQVAARTMAPFN